MHSCHLLRYSSLFVVNIHSNKQNYNIVIFQIVICKHLSYFAAPAYRFQ